MKSRGGLGSSSSLAFIFSRSFLLRTAPHYLNAWNRLVFAPHEILLFPTADRRFDTKVKCPTGRASFWVKFLTVRSLTRVKCPGIARRGGGDGRFWNWLVHYGRWSLTKMEPQGSLPRRCKDTSTLWKIIYCMQFLSYNMCCSMLIRKFFVYSR